ncbi:hypothetical protein [Flavobacterium capsici]|uniref:Uncharacterized protein n=1 Tax=Flavobacterium capsici TaxID=3075618 RepID=A0AA96EZU4_9FLAO|nr:MULTISPECIES: hypothetical protein [unclassified Flavobacterium]WNM20318.1 hypothetical protein RN608_06470 [Flavobacterium sp. PMR2A8]WNM21708.1 hypothetical protein RN605_13640 [Flavobacterium sp. PMTSA4]
MKTIKTLLVVVILALGSQANAQKILDKWEELNNVNQIVTKINYIANEGRYDLIPEYATILETYTAKLDVKTIEAYGFKGVSESINNLKTQATALNTNARLKTSKEEIKNNLDSFNQTLTTLIGQCKLE